MSIDAETADRVAHKLALMYQQPFGGKEKGRYRIAIKLLRKLAERRRIYVDDVAQIGRALLERGYILIDMDSFFVVMSANSYINYRRANEDSIV